MPFISALLQYVATQDYAVMITLNAALAVHHHQL